MASIASNGTLLWRSGVGLAREGEFLCRRSGQPCWRICHNLTYRSCQEHDKRVDAVLKLPPEALRRVMESGDFRTSLLALKAAFKVLDKYRGD